MEKTIKDFRSFWPLYLKEHANPVNRRLHFIGTTQGLIQLIGAAVTRNPWLILTGIATGYAFAWVGHFVFEKNKPATFTHPWLSFLGDWKMWALMATGKLQLGAEDVTVRTQNPQAS